VIRERKKVLFLVPAFSGGVGGAERVIATILRHLDHSKFECHLALVGTGGAYLEGVPPAVTVHELGVSRMRYSLPSIIRLVRKVRPQTILSTVMHLNVMVMLARPFFHSRPRILLREAILPSAFLAHDTRHPRLWKWLYRRLYPKAEQIICLFDGMANDLAQNFGIPSDKLVRIHNPVDIAKVRSLADGSQSPYSGPGPNLVAVGRLQHQKAYDVLLRAFLAVLQAVPDARLAILGEGPLEADLKAQARTLGVDHAVDFMGFQANPWTYIKHADLFVLASRFEGLPNVVLEALALGTPVVATDCPGGIRDIARSGGPINLVPPGSSDALAEGILVALRQIKEMPSTAPGTMPCLKDFEVKEIAAEYSRLF
jgi:glycosyltransferase involved in cell wall biosynthesis